MLKQKEKNGRKKMLSYSELYPVNNGVRTAQLLDGLWRFQFDPLSIGMEQDWYKNGLPNAISMPVPASFSDLFTTKEERDYCGDYWYELPFFLPQDCKEKKQYIRFGSVTHRCEIFCNGILVAKHEGGFLPIVADVTDIAKKDMENLLIIKANNELNETSIPCGMTIEQKNNTKLSLPYFDFFNYSGIQRSVWLVQTAAESISDYTLTYQLASDKAIIHYEVVTNGQMPVTVELKDADGRIVARNKGKNGELCIQNPHLWKVRNAYLYTFTAYIVDGEKIIDQYNEKVGIRTIEIKDSKFYINGERVYLKGYGKHEDADIIGKGFNYGIAKRDFECMKWTNANCFRTSHYPYSEEWYQMADEEGFLIIDEVPAVGMMRSLVNFAEAGEGKSGCEFFKGCDNIELLQTNHINALEEMITRDKNHPSVFSWSIFNEAETRSEEAYQYFKKIFDFARACDPQKRPLTGALEKSSSPEQCLCHSLMDFICLNRYYGWYLHGGAQIETAFDEFLEEMEQWKHKNLKVPFIFTEYGADTLESLHKLPGVMWSQEYQNEYMNMNFDVFDKYDFVQGELTWNFADFQTTQGIMRVNGNKKGIFTRNRQPKAVAYVMKERWGRL